MVGIVVCLALVVGVVLGRGWVAGAVTDVAGSIDAAVARTEPLLGTASDGIAKVATAAGEAAAAADRIATDPNATPQALQTVLERLGAVSQRYLELRSTYAGAREQVVSALDRLAIVDRFVPGVSVPQGPIDALAALDERARALDAQVVGLIDAGAAIGAVNSTAAAIAEKAHAVEAGLGTISASVDDVEARLANLRSEIAHVADTVSSLLTVIALVLVVLLLYLALLHLVLFRSSRGHARGNVAA
jgi:methyl-accepting chemotaxis protein